MNFLDLAKERYSVRSFSTRKVEEDKIDEIIEAGCVAPTACNLQPQRIIVVKTEEAIEKMERCTRAKFHATLAFLVCYDKNRCWIRDYDGKSSGEIDASIAATHMMLEASSIGIGSTWVMHFIPEAIYEEFSLPSNLIPVALLEMGYPSADVKPASGHYNKKPISDIVSEL